MKHSRKTILPRKWIKMKSVTGVMVDAEME